MKHYIHLISLLSLIILFQPITTANHIVGGDIRYECLGDITVNGTPMKTYRITLKLYRDCNATGQNVAWFDTPANLAVYTGNGTLIEQFIAPLQGPVNITPQIGPCVILPPDVCVHTGTYVTTINLPENPDGYHIVYQRCCRNQTITNIFTPGNYGATYSTFITHDGQLTCNNNPEFDDFPPIVICANQPLFFDHGATDPEGDSLVYTFCNPLNGGTRNEPQPVPPAGPPYTNVPFTPPLDAGNPLGGSPQVTIDSVTGIITGTPTITGQFVVGVCVQEYRNGVLIGEIRRDFQFNVTECIIQVQADIEEDVQIGPREFVINSCGDSIITIVNESGQPANITGYYWEFDLNNGTTANSTDTDPTFNFPGVGVYDGFLIVNPSGGACTDTAIIHVNIFPPPIAAYSFDYDSCAIGPIAFTDQSQSGSPEDSILTWFWEFGDGRNTDTLDPIYQYLDAGTFDVRLTVSDVNNCVTTYSEPITWAPTPIIEVVPSTFVGCVPLDVTFQNNSYPITGYTTDWNLGDGTLSTAASPNHTYTTPGTYTVTIHITSPLGCEAKDTFPNLIQVHNPPIANATASFDSCVFGPVAFTDLSVAGDTAIKSWLWQLGDGSVAADTNVMYQYLNAGSYEVALEIRDFNNCVSTHEQIIDWFPAPIIQIGQSLYEGCSPYTVQITNNSYPINGYSLEWDMGDGTSSTVASPTHTYSDIAAYTLSLTVTSPTGCVGSQVFDNLVVVNPNPEADFTFSPTQATSLDPTIQFQDASNSAIAWQWGFGTEATSFEQNPTHTFADTGYFDVMLVATHPTGCQDTTWKVIDIAPVFTYYLPNAFTPNDDGTNDGFKGIGTTMNFQHFDMKIFNRWGELVFETSDPFEAWDGKKNGKWVKNGVYVCLVKLEGPRGKPYTYKSLVTVVR